MEIDYAKFDAIIHIVLTSQFNYFPSLHTTNLSLYPKINQSSTQNIVKLLF